MLNVKWVSLLVVATLSMAASFAAQIPGLCGIGLYGEHGRDWVWYGGYSQLHRPVPMYWPADEAELAANAPAFDTLLWGCIERTL